ncbi:hypothetical protein [Streptomyces sp. NPDC029674]|uniref:hypothetical protein n=1 Tax=Streptomyces sp. NPDC029674 TaxID=3365297 RepID=UPI0038513579
MNTPPPRRSSPLQRLRTLREDGRLAACWPEVAPLLAQVTDPGPGGRDRAAVLDELLACGRILAEVDAAEVRGHHPATPLVTVVLTGHAPTARLTAPLTAELARHGLPLRLVTGEQGAYLRDLTDPYGQLVHVRADMTLCVLDAGAVFDELAVPWDVADAELACARLAGRLRAMAVAHAGRGQGTLVLNTLPLLRTHTHQLVGERPRTQLCALWRDFNAELLRLAAAHPGIAAVDLDPLVAETGPARDTGPDATGAPFSDALLAAYAREVGHLLRARSGPTKKRLALGLDDPLRAGAPDGGAEARPGRPGGPHAALHAAIRQLAARGALLARTDGNQPPPVYALPRENDALTGTNTHRRPKDADMRAIAERLGIDASSPVLIDAHATERTPAARTHPPDTAVAPLDTEPARHVERLLQDDWFTTPTTPGPTTPTPAAPAPPASPSD